MPFSSLSRLQTPPQGICPAATQTVYCVHVAPGSEGLTISPKSALWNLSTLTGAARIFVFESSEKRPAEVPRRVHVFPGFDYPVGPTRGQGSRMCTPVSFVIC